MQQLRGYFTERGFITASALADQPDGDQVTVAGAVTHRQRPQTANGVTFLSLEDETGLANAILTQGLVARFGNTVLRSSVLAVRGRVEHDHGAVNLLAEHLEPITRPAVVAESKDWA
jgi:error-prone DNA polymerase